MKCVHDNLRYIFDKKTVFQSSSDDSQIVFRYLGNVRLIQGLFRGYTACTRARSRRLLLRWHRVRGNFVSQWLKEKEEAAAAAAAVATAAVPRKTIM